MTVAELIQALQSMPQDAPVYWQNKGTERRQTGRVYGVDFDGCAIVFFHDEDDLTYALRHEVKPPPPQL